MMLTATAITAGLAWWLGLYLLARGPHKPLLLRAGTGLLAYALALACDGLRLAAPGTPAEAPLAGVGTLLVFVPALCWVGVVLLMLPETLLLRPRLDWLWRLGLLPLGLLALVVAAFTGWPAPLTLAIAGLVLLPLAGCLALLFACRRDLRPGGTGGLLLTATLFVALSAALLLAPLLSLSRPLLVLGIGGDLALLGLAVARFDAFDEGETLRRDMLRSWLGATVAALLFGGQVALVLFFATGVGLAMAALLFSTIAAAIAAQVLAGPLQALLDRLAFPAAPQLQQARAELRAAAEALPRRDDQFALEDLDEAEFVRLTRRALSHYGDLPRLAGSPLTELPAVTARLANRGAPDQPLERAAELKAMLAESITRLKPRNDEPFGTSDEWRHYNALYFPYVAGLRPYSRRASHNGLDPIAREALEWLATQVPERTLYNWQNAAARLVAADLRPYIVVTPPMAASGSVLSRHGSGFEGRLAV